MGAGFEHGEGASDHSVSMWSRRCRMDARWEIATWNRPTFGQSVKASVVYKNRLACALVQCHRCALPVNQSSNVGPFHFHPFPFPLPLPTFPVLFIPVLHNKYFCSYLELRNMYIGTPSEHTSSRYTSCHFSFTCSSRAIQWWLNINV